MIAQLSQSAPRGRPSSSSSGVRSAGSLARNSGVLFFPHTSSSSNSSPAARTKIRAVRLLTLGLRMLSVFLGTCSSLALAVWVSWRSVVRERRSRSPDERLDGIRQVVLGDVVVASPDPDLVRLQQHVDVRVAERRLEAVRAELAQQAQRILEVDRVHEATVLDAAVTDRALVEPRHRLLERRLRDGEGDV